MTGERGVFSQVVGSHGGGQWTELARDGTPPGGVPVPPEGPLEALIAWLPSSEHVRVRSAMQAVRLGARPQRWRIEDSGAQLEVSGGTWAGGQWAYALRTWPDGAMPPPVPTFGARAPGGDARESGPGTLDYMPELDRLVLDAVACRLHGLPESLGPDVPLARWAACFHGDDRFVAISRLCWSAPTEAPLRLVLRLARPRPGAERIELLLERGAAGRRVRGTCRLLPGA